MRDKNRNNVVHGATAPLHDLPTSVASGLVRVIYQAQGAATALSIDSLKSLAF